MEYFITHLIAFILGIFSNFFYDHLKGKFKQHKKDELRTVLADAKCWINSGEGLYSYGKDPAFKIKISDRETGLSERFSKFPDRKHDGIAWVEAKYGDASLFGWNFMYLDGCRYFVPVPEGTNDTSDQYYDYYDLNSLQIRIFHIIGEANYIGEATKIQGLKNIAKHLNITVTEL